MGDMVDYTLQGHMNELSHWATGIGIIDAADLLVESALDNANISRKMDKKI